MLNKIIRAMRYEERVSLNTVKDAEIKEYLGAAAYDSMPKTYQEVMNDLYYPCGDKHHVFEGEREHEVLSFYEKFKGKHADKLASKSNPAYQP